MIDKNSNPLYKFKLLTLTVGFVFLITAVISILFFMGRLNFYKVLEYVDLNTYLINHILFLFSIKQVLFYLWVLCFILTIIFMFVLFKNARLDKSDLLIIRTFKDKENQDKLVSFILTDSWGKVLWFSPLAKHLLKIPNIDIKKKNSSISIIDILKSNPNLSLTENNILKILYCIKYKHSGHIDIPLKVGRLDSAFRLSFMVVGTSYLWQTMRIQRDSIDKEDILEDALSNIALPVVLNTESGKIIFSNKSFNKLFKFSSQSDISGVNYLNFIVNISDSNTSSDTKKLTINKVLYKNVNNEEFWAYCLTTFNYQDDKLRYLRNVLIPLDHDEFNFNLDMSNLGYLDYLEEMYKKAPFGIFLLDQKDRFLKYNDNVINLLNVDPLVLDSGANIYDVLNNKNSYLVTKLEEARTTQTEVEIELFDKMLKFVCFPIFGDTRIIYVLDLTYSKALESEIKHSQGLQTVGQIASVVAHDFNNLLTAIMSFTYFAQEQQDKEDPTYSELEQIKQNANKAKIMIKQLLTFSRKQELKPVSFSVNSEISDLMSTILRLMGDKITPSFKRGKNVGNIIMDKVQFQQVLTNLAVNAKDAMKGGDKLEIFTSAINIKTAKPCLLDTISSGMYVCIEIKDYGTGISEENLQKIFKAHFSTKGEKGNGLGLSTVNKLITDSAGYIDVKTKLGEGTSFYIYLPKDESILEREVETDFSVNKTTNSGKSPHSNKEEPITQKEDVITKKSVSKKDIIKKKEAVTEVFEVQTVMDLTGTETILFVEDEAPVRMVCTRLLKNKGYNVIEAQNGKEAIDYLENHDVRHIDLVISDVMMPIMNGPELVGRVRDKFPNIKAILISGYTEDVLDDISSDVSIKGIEFLAKPFTPDVFATKVKTVINQ